MQAAIAACHATAPTAAETDWVEIATLYGALARLNASAVVELNRAVAVAMADGPEAGLRLVDEIEAGGALDGYHLLPATRRICCGGSTGTRRPRSRTAPRSRSPPASPNAATSNAAWPR